MFWKRAERRSANTTAIANTFGEAHAQTFQAAEKLAATTDLVTLYLAALRLVRQTEQCAPGLAVHLASELSDLNHRPEAERIEGLTGYVALSSLLDRLDFIPAMPAHAIIPTLRAVNADAPIWQWAPLQAWIDLNQGVQLDAAPLLCTWDHVCCVYLLTVADLYSSDTILDKSEDHVPLLERRMFKLLTLINHAAWRHGMLHDAPQTRPDDATAAYLVAAQVVYERFRGGAAIRLLDDLAEAAAGGMIRNYTRAVPLVMRARGLTDSIPDGLLRDEPSILTLIQMMTVIDTAMFSTSQKASLFRDQINHQERLTYLAHHDPIVPLCQGQ